MNSILAAMLAAMLNGATVGALVAAAVWVGLRAAPRRALNAATRYWVWWAALVVVVMLPLGYLRVAPPSRAVGTPELVRNAGVGRAVMPRVHDRALPVETVIPSNVPTTWIGLSFPIVVAAGAGPTWILAAWGAISAMMLARLALCCILLGRRKTRAWAGPPHLTARIEEWLRRSGGTRRQVQVACSAEIGTPMLAGLRRPVILIPERLMGELEPGELEQIGLHEAAHLARRDDYALLAQRTIEALFACHPVVRWITRQVDLEREIACDDIVVETTGLARRYADCLTRIVELCGGVRASWASTPAADDRSHLARRVDRLLERNREGGTRPGKARLAAAIAVVAVLAGVAGRAPGVVAFAMPAASVPAASLTDDPQPAEETAATDATGSEQSAGEAPEPPQTPAPPQRAAAPVNPAKVVIPVTVQEPLNRFVTGLRKENFKVFEDGVEQEISEFSSKDAPLSVGIVVDASGSMSDKLNAPRLAVAQFLSAANPQDEYFLVTFNDSADLAAGFTSDTGLIQDRLNFVRARGGTALRDAINRALGEMQSARNPDRALLVISDGNDNSSSLSQEALRELVRAANVQIYAITFAEPGVSGIRGQAMLGQIAEQSGGQQMVVDDLAKAPGAAASVAVRNVYLLGYRPKNGARDGKFRSVRVEAVAPEGLPALKVRSRIGYYAPAQ
jgi:VWFA-related protein